MSRTPRSTPRRIIDGARGSYVLHDETRHWLESLPMSAVAYLESLEYTGTGWQQGLPYPLMEFRAPFESELNDDDPSSHDDSACDEYESLCTGDGYRWSPTLPKLRFT